MRVHRRPTPSSRPFRTLFLLALAGAAILQAAFTALENGPGGWRRAAASTPLEMKIWTGFDTASNVDFQDSPRLALVEALDSWVRNSGLPLVVSETAIDSVGRDGTNVITIADNPTNRSAVGSGFLGRTLIWQQVSGSVRTVLETDVVFNPVPDKRWSTVELDNRYSLFDVAQHEFGHVAGLSHTISRGSRMFAFSGTFDFGRGRISWGDIADVNRRHPSPGLDLITGSISGKVTKNGAPVFGAFVLAVDDRGVVMGGAITWRDGRYELDYLPPGRYLLYVEPLDGPTFPAHVAEPDFPEGELDANFLPRFYRDSAQPQVTVSAGSRITGTDFAVVAGQTPVDPEFVGVNPDANGTLWVNTAPASAPLGERTNFIIAGRGTAEVRPDGATVLGSSVFAGGLQRTASNSQNTVFKVYSLQAGAEAPVGDYSVALRSDSHLGIVSGGLEIYPAQRFLQAFGQFVHAPSVARSEVLLVNTHVGGWTQGTLTTRSQDGSGVPVPMGVGSLANGRTAFSLPPGGSARIATEGDASFEGSLEAEADRPIGSALLLETVAGVTGVGASRPMRSFVAPVEVRGGGAADTGVAIANLDPRPVQIFLRLHDQNGTVRGQTTLEVPGRGQTAKLINELIPIPGSDFRGVLLATANRRVSATVIRLSPGVFTTFPVIEKRVSQKTFFAQFANSGSLASELLLVNPSPTRSASSVKVQFRQSDGAAASVTLNGILYRTGVANLQIPALGMLKLGTSGSGAFVGSVEVSSDVPVGGVVLFSSPDFGTAGVGESQPGHKWVIPIDRDQSAGVDTGVALFNTAARAGLATLTVRDGAGQIVAGPKNLSLQAYRQLAAFPNQDPLRLNLPDKFAGSLWIECDAPLAVTALRQSPAVLTTFPAVSREQFVTPSEP